MTLHPLALFALRASLALLVCGLALRVIPHHKTMTEISHQTQTVRP